MAPKVTYICTHCPNTQIRKMFCVCLAQNSFLCPFSFACNIEIPFHIGYDYEIYNKERKKDEKVESNALL